MAHKSLTKAIAKLLAAGNICYIHRESLKITPIIDLAEGEEHTPEQQKEVEALENKIHKYYKVPRMSAHEAVHVMKDFVNEPLDTALQRELKNALKRKNPSRNFLQTIENDELLAQQWRNFKAKWYQEWVRGYLLDIYRY